MKSEVKQVNLQSFEARVPGANGQGETVEHAKESLKDAIRLIFEDRVQVMTRGLPADAIQTKVAI